MPNDASTGGVPNGGGIVLKCPQKYELKGPQIEPAASYWNHCPSLRVVEIDRLKGIRFDPYPVGEATLVGEIEELVYLSARRDDPKSLVGDFQGRPGTKRLAVSRFLNDPAFRPPPLGSVAPVRANDQPLLQTGRGLARYYESETPGINHRQALAGLLRKVSWSPPRQALAWAALDITLASSLMAAWYHKWISGVGTSFRPRPVECYLNLSVLYDNPDELNPMIPPCPPPDEPGKRFSRGTPRHPAYPSGHSTYAGAGSEILSWFFPKEKAEFDKLADNIGMARLWAGIHWRSDHVEGVKLGRAVARLVIEDLEKSGIEFPAPKPPPCNMAFGAPDITILQGRADEFKEKCGTHAAGKAPADPEEAAELAQSVQAGGV
jgi:PAP2 superfamily